MATYKQGDRVRYVGNDTPDMRGYEGVVQEETSDSNVNVLWEGPMLSFFRKDGSSGVYPRNVQLVKNEQTLADVQEAALKPRSPFMVFDESDSLDHTVWSTVAPLEADLKKYKDFAAYRLNRMNELKREITKLNETVKANEDFIQLQGSRLRARLEQIERIREVCNNVSSIDP